MLNQVITALLAHYWFKTHEPSAKTAVGYLLVLPLCTPILSGQSQITFSEKISNFSARIVPIALEYLAFCTFLALSIVAYRLSPFHPLAKYPGPIFSRVTKLWGTWIIIRGDNHRYIQQLHQHYGTVVRVGPNELSIVEKDAIPHVLGTQGMPKGPLWDGRRFHQASNDKGYDTIIDVRDRNIQEQLRKPWNQAFSSAPVKDYHDLLELRGKQLRDHLQALVKSNQAQGVDLSKWLSFFAFDFMGHLAFGGCFELMRDGDVHGLWQAMEEGLDLPAAMQTIPWINPVLTSIPFISAKMKAFSEFGVQQSKKRLAMQTRQKDLFYHLYERPAEQSGRPVEDQLDLIVSDSLLTIVAGSDTTATTLTAILCHVFSDRRIYSALQRELDEAFPVDSFIDGWPNIEIDKLTKLAYLNAAINEGLRLVPAVPSNLQRSPEPGSGGKMLGDTKIFIPEGVSVNIAPYALHRDPRYFSPSPEAYIPERWLSTAESKETYNTNREAFIPFSHGPANCAGKSLALVELRYVVATMILCFDIHHASCKGASPQVLEEKAKSWVHCLKDKFVFGKSKLHVDIGSRI